MSYFDNVAQIELHFENRIENINATYTRLFETYSGDIEFELLKQIYINYYLCFSSAIESLTRLIIMHKSSSNDYVKSKLAFENEKRPHFIGVDDLKRLIGTDAIFNINSRSYYNWLNGKVVLIYEDDIRLYDSDRRLFEFENFVDVYASAKKARNTVAHSLSLNTSFNNKMIIRFSKILFLLIQQI